VSGFDSLWITPSRGPPLAELPRTPIMSDFFRRLTNSRRHSEDGASAVEYGLLVAGIAALIVAIVFLLGGVIKSSFSKTCGAISAKGSASATC
jgi:pilus assembly protein Flp/PilA